MSTKIPRLKQMARLKQKEHMGHSEKNQLCFLESPKAEARKWGKENLKI